jgi:hypothetical protein
MVSSIVEMVPRIFAAIYCLCELNISVCVCACVCVSAPEFHIGMNTIYILKCVSHINGDVSAFCMHLYE